MKPPKLTRRTHLVLGVGCYVVGSRLLYAAYDGAGRKAPWLVRWLPGV